MGKLKAQTIINEETKFNIVIRSFIEGNSLDDISKEFGISRQSITNWRKEFIKNGPKIFQQKKQEQSKIIPEKEYNRAIRENNLLKKLLEHYKKIRT